MKNNNESFFESTGKVFLAIGTLAIMKKMGIYELSDSWSSIIVRFVFSFLCIYFSD